MSSVQSETVESTLLSAAASYLWGGRGGLQIGAQISNSSAEFANSASTVTPPLYRVVFLTGPP